MIIRIRVIPNGEENEVVGRIGSVVRVKVVTPEVSEVANKVLINYLAEFFEVRSNSIHIMRGEKAREIHRFGALDIWNEKVSRAVFFL